MEKLSSALYGLARTAGKIASTSNDIEQLGKTIETGDPSHIAKRMVRKEINRQTHQGSNKIASMLTKLVK